MHVISVVGKHDIGKTYLLEQIIPKLLKKYEIAVIKHTVHKIKRDMEETDTNRLSKAGSKLTAIISDDEIDISLKGNQINLSQVISILKNIKQNLDILFLEGYKKEPFPKIVIIDNLDYLDQFRDAEIILIVSKNSDLVNENIVDFNDIDMILDRIEKYIKNPK